MLHHLFGYISPELDQIYGNIFYPMNSIFVRLHISFSPMAPSYPKESLVIENMNIIGFEELGISDLYPSFDTSSI